MKIPIGFITFFSLTIAVFLYPLITMRSGFLWGDSFVQFFPWLKCYAESIRSLSFPYWVKSMGSGFPLMAEGQIGGFYPFNILFFFILPFEVAYNYAVIFQFAIGGIFTYLYTRKLGADQFGGSLAALLFCFGSAYAGCFYNIVTLRTLAWFPLVLLLIECYFDKGGLRYIFFGGIILGIQFLAGFVQMAAYSAFFYSIYFIYKAAGSRIGIKRALTCLAIFLATSVILALPQLVLTCQLARYSSREGASAGFALWGSFFPSGLLGMVFPYSLSFGGHLYVGVLSLLFIIFSLCLLKNKTVLRPVALIFVLSVFFALGSYNPVYTMLLKLTKLYMFRNPSKFLFFASFSLSVLAGVGLTEYFNAERAETRRKSALIFLAVLSVAGSLFLAAKALLFYFKEDIIRLGGYYVRNFIYNKPHHRYSIEYYLEKVRLSYESMAGSFSFYNVFVILSLCIFIAAALYCLLPARKKSRYIAIGLIFIDIFIFSFYGKGFRHNIRPFTYLTPDKPRILERLKNDHQVYRILPFNIKSGKLPNWALPNANITYGIDSTACYTPLASRIYRDSLPGLELVDDSLGLENPDNNAVKNNIGMLRLLNVKYIVSPEILSLPFLEKIDSEGDTYLYKLSGYLPRLFFSYDAVNDVRQAPLPDFRIVTYKDGLIKAELTADRDGFVVFSENYYPGWRVFVDGKEKAIIKVKEILQGVQIDKGRHSVVFIYKGE